MPLVIYRAENLSGSSLARDFGHIFRAPLAQQSDVPAVKPLFAILAACVLLLVVLGEPNWHVKVAPVCAERPVVNVPVAFRQLNWLGSQREGSCSWASLVTSLNWCGEYDKAKLVRSQEGNGESPTSLASNMTRLGVKYAWTVGQDDIAFLEQALASRRAVMVAIDEDDANDDECHMVVLAHLDGSTACLIDNNDPSEDRWMSRQEFLQEWVDTGSWAVVPLYSPVPPLATYAH